MQMKFDQFKIYGNLTKKSVLLNTQGTITLQTMRSLQHILWTAV